MNEARVGYKIAVGINKNEGFFPVVVKLEIPKEASIVEPFRPIQIENNEVENCICDIKDNKNKYYSKYRTNFCKVLDVYPLDGEFRPNWNNVGYSLYEIGTFLAVHKYDSSFLPFEYYRDKICSSALNGNLNCPCGEGIHFFETEQIAREYFYFDVEGWIQGNLIELNEHLANLSYCRRAQEEGDDFYINHCDDNFGVEVLYKKCTGEKDISFFSKKGK